MSMCTIFNQVTEPLAAREQDMNVAGTEGSRQIGTRSGPVDPPDDPPPPPPPK